MDAKTRSDAWGENLPDDLRRQIYAYTRPPAKDEAERPFIENFDEACGFLLSRGLAVPSRAGWYRFLARMRRDEKLALVARAASSGETAADLASEASVDPAVAAAAFDALAVDAATDGDGKTAALYANAAAKYRDAVHAAADLELRRAAQKVKEEELKIAQEKLALLQAKEAKAVATVANETLTPEQREARLKEIFGLS